MWIKVKHFRNNYKENKLKPGHLWDNTIIQIIFQKEYLQCRVGFFYGDLLDFNGHFLRLGTLTDMNVKNMFC